MPNEATPTAARLREVLHYDPETGVFTHRLNSRGTSRRAGDLAGSAHGDDGYLTVCIDGRNRYAHRMAWLYMTGQPPTHRIDHINGDKSDNRWSNLRDVTPSENGQNQRSAHVDSRTGYLGVTYDKTRRKYYASIIIDRRRIYLGRFPTAEQAHAAYVTAKRQIHPAGML